MSAAATLEREPEQQMVSTKPGTVTFMARRENLKLVKRAERNRRNAEGDVVEVIPGERLQFVDGLLRVPPAGEIGGEKDEPIDAESLLLWLEGGTDPKGKKVRAHPLFGDREEGFWRVDEPAPAVTPEEMDALTDLAVSQDAEGIEALIAQEEAGWGREGLLGSARKLLERVQANGSEPAPAERPTSQSPAEG